MDGLRISIPKSVVTGAMYGTGTTQRQADARADAVKRKRKAGPDILNPQIRALEATDEALDTDNTTEHNTKGQEASQHQRTGSLAHESSYDAQTMLHM